MLLAVVNKNPKVISDELLKPLIAVLPESVASALTCNEPGGKLTDQDIGVWVRDFGPYDINIKDIGIIILADFSPERQKTLELRRKLLCDLVRYILPEEIKGFVQVFLLPASYGEF